MPRTPPPSSTSSTSSTHTYTHLSVLLLAPLPVAALINSCPEFPLRWKKSPRPPSLPPSLRIMDPHKQLINALTFHWLALQTVRQPAAIAAQPFQTTTNSTVLSAVLHISLSFSSSLFSPFFLLGLHFVFISFTCFPPPLHCRESTPNVIWKENDAKKCTDKATERESEREWEQIGLQRSKPEAQEAVKHLSERKIGPVV